MKLFKTYGTLIVAKSRDDARKVMREEWGEVYPVKLVNRPIEMTTDGEDTIKMRPSEIAKAFPRGIISNC